MKNNIEKTKSLMEAANRVTNAMPISENELDEASKISPIMGPSRVYPDGSRPPAGIHYYGGPDGYYGGGTSKPWHGKPEPNWYGPRHPDHSGKSNPYDDLVDSLDNRANNSPMTNPNNPGTMPMTPTYGPALMPDGTPVGDPFDQPMGPPYYPPGYFVRRPVDPSKFTTPTRPTNPYVTNPNNPGTRVP